MMGLPISLIRAYAYRGGQWQRLVFQIDEVNSNGDYVLAGGLPFTAGSDDGYFDGNDELVIDGRDLGDEFSAADVAKLKDRSDRFFKLRFCRDAAFVGEVLLTYGVRTSLMPFDEPPVKLSLEPTTVVSEAYRYEFHEANPALLGKVLLRSAKGYEPAIGRSDFKMPLALPWFLPNMTFQAADFEAAIESWQEGPVRTIVAVGVKYRAFLNLFKLHLFTELVFYRNRFQIPTVVEFIFEPKRFLNPGSGIAYAIWFSEGSPWSVESNLEAISSVGIDELVESGARAGNKGYWAHAQRGDQRLAVQVRVDPAAAAQVPPPLIYQASSWQTAEHEKVWPTLHSLGGDMGVFLDFSQLKEGQYDFGLDLVLSSGADDKFTDLTPVIHHWHELTPRN